MKIKRTLAMAVMLVITQQHLLAQVVPGSPTPLAAASEQDRNKAVARRVFDEIFNQGRFEVADEIYAPDFRNHGVTRTGHSDRYRTSCLRDGQEDVRR